MKLIKISALLSVLVCGFVSATTFNSAENIGSYNLILKNDLSTQADIEGAIFIGGDLNGSNATTFGNNCTGSCLDVDAVTILGDVNRSFNLDGDNTNGTRNVVYGGTLSGSASSNNGNGNNGNGNNGNGNNGNGNGNGNNTGINNNAGGEVRQAVDAELSMLESALDTLFEGAIEDSANFAALSDNDSSNDIISFTEGTVVGNNSQNGEITQNSNEVTFENPSTIDGDALVFTLSGDVLASTNIRFNIDALADVTVPIIVNVTGATSSTNDTLIVGSGFTSNFEPVRSNLIFNFNNFNTISFTQNGFEGSVLAPQADVSITTGAFDGGLVALSLTTTAELHAVLFDGEFGDDEPNPTSEVVPAPSAILIATLGLIYSVRRRKVSNLN